MRQSVHLDSARLRDTMGRLVEEHHLPGLAVGVIADEDLVFAEGCGYADIESERPQSPDLRHRIGSITKTMVGPCAMALVEEGRLNLRDRVVDLLPDVAFHGPAESMTVWHLLTHTSGIGEMPNTGDFADPDFKLWMSGEEFPGVPQAYPDGITVEVPPGTKWAYANHGWVLMGEIIARAEAAPIEDVLQKRVFEPLGMSSTDLLDQPHPDLTTGYHREPSEDVLALLRRAGREPPAEEAVDGYNIRGDYQFVRGKAAGSTQSTITDMAKYASALLRDGKGIVQRETFAEMVAPQWCPDPRLASQGIGFQLRSFYGESGFGHGGGVIGGWNSYLQVFPERDMAVLLHMNLSYDDFDTVVLRRILQAALSAPDESLPTSPIDPRILASAPAVYEAPAPGPLTNFRIMNDTGRIMISQRDGRLYLKARRGPWKEEAPLLAIDPDQPDLFAIADGYPEAMRLAFILDEDGKVSGFRLSRLAEMIPNEEAQPW